MANKAVIIRTDETREVVEFTNKTSYDVISTAVGGRIECVNIFDKTADLWLNEEGKIEGLPQNPIGTSIWADNYGLTDVIVGDIIITGGTDEEGETLGLTDSQVEFYLNFTGGITYTGDPSDFLGVTVTGW